MLPQPVEVEPEHPGTYSNGVEAIRQTAKRQGASDYVEVATFRDRCCADGYPGSVDNGNGTHTLFFRPSGGLNQGNDEGGASFLLLAVSDFPDYDERQGRYVAVERNVGDLQ